MTETYDPRCLAASEALAAGDTAAMAEHAQTCQACAFLVTLVPDLGQTLGGAGIGGAFEAILDRAIKTGELLLSRYRIEHTIARGGQGIMCRATDREFGIVAIKILRCNPTSRDEPLPEGRVAMKLGGEGVCRIFNIERHGDIRMIVMELIDGECLEDALPRLSQGQRLAIFRRVCEAVGRIHKDGILHLDLKPRNIVLRDDETPVVTDFGIAVPLDRDGTATPLGHTRDFAPPEQCAGDRVDRRADVYALGKMLQRLVIAPSSHIRRVIARATNPDPAQRYPDATAVLRELDRPARVRRSLSRMIAIAVVSTCVVGGAVALAMTRRSDDATTKPAVVDVPEVMLLDFDHVQTFGQPDNLVDATPYFLQSGIKLAASAGTEVVIENTLGFYSGQALVPFSGPNVLTQRGDVSDPIFFTLTFPRRVAKISFRRPKLISATPSGITFPRWSWSALDRWGNEVRGVAEAFGKYVDVSAKEFTLEGRCLDSVRFESDNGSRSAFRAIVIDDLVLTFANATDCDDHAPPNAKN